MKRRSILIPVAMAAIMIVSPLSAFSASPGLASSGGPVGNFTNISVSDTGLGLIRDSDVAFDTTTLDFNGVQTTVSNVGITMKLTE